MFGVLNFNREKETAANLAAWKAAVGVLIDDADRLFWRMESPIIPVYSKIWPEPQVYAKANSDQDVGLGADCAADYVLNRLAANESALCELVGREHYRSLLRSVEGAREAEGIRPTSWWRRRVAEFLLTFGRLTHSSWLTLQGERVWRS